MANNIFLNANYGWAFYVSDTKLLDQKTTTMPSDGSGYRESGSPAASPTERSTR